MNRWPLNRYLMAADNSGGNPEVRKIEANLRPPTFLQIGMSG